jgi:uncharacterized protein (DUF302 family)
MGAWHRYRPGPQERLSDMNVRNTSSAIQVVHESTELPVGYDDFTTRFEAILGRFDPSVEPLVVSNLDAARERIGKMAGEQGLMIFGTQDHGALLAIAGTPRKAKRYHIGNPLIALQMTQHDIRAGLYAPLTVLVYETGPSTVRVEFDRPSSLFGQFENPAVTRVATELDKKLSTAIETAAHLANR